MQTNLLKSFRNTSAGLEADSILRKCVHCGFCNATCPTYQLLGDEADGPRGRIYQIKEMLEGAPVSEITQKHLDRCLLCRSCETTCPSGVNYSRLVEIGQVFQQHINRPFLDRFKRYFIQAIVPYPARIRALARLVKPIRFFIPGRISRQLPSIQKAGQWPTALHQRRILIHEGCVQSAVESNINSATAKVLDSVGISATRLNPVLCCGALYHHLSSKTRAQQLARENIDQWWPHVESGVEAIINSSSGCQLMIKDYPKLLEDDAHYADKAQTVARLASNLVQVLAKESVKVSSCYGHVAVFQSPCSLQHGLQLDGYVERFLSSLGIEVKTPDDAHLCCGSAGSYSILQPVISRQLLESKLKALKHKQPDYILTANIGCLLHIKYATTLPVMHWIEFIAENLNEAKK